MTDEQKLLGPLAYLLGTWEGDKGNDEAPSNADRKETAISKYRERMTFSSIGRVDNHEQVLYGVSHQTMAWRLDEKDAFHQDSGYWLWDAANKQLIRCLVVPRGISLLAGGTVAADATSFELSATRGAEIYGICSNPFLDAEFRTVRFDFKLEFEDDGVFRYWQDAVIEVKGNAEPFHHIDQNRMVRIED